MYLVILSHLEQPDNIINKWFLLTNDQYDNKLKQSLTKFNYKLYDVALTMTHIYTYNQLLTYIDNFKSIESFYDIDWRT